MKKLYTMILMAVVLFAACTHENDPVVKQIVTIQASIANDSRVALGEGKNENKVNWTEGDKITLNIDEGEYGFTWQEGTTFAYTGNASLPSLTPGTQITATYVSTFNATQTGLKADVGNYMALSATTTVETGQDYSDLELRFSHGTSVLKLTLINEDFQNNNVAKITLKAGGTIVAEATETAEKIFTRDTDGNVTAYFAIQPEALNNVTIHATCNGNTYFGTLSNKTLESGKLYNASATLANACFLPNGLVFNSAVNTFLKGYIINDDELTLKKIQFIADPTWTPTTGTQIGECGAYMVANTTDNILEIRTATSSFVFNKDCSNMFCGIDIDFDEGEITGLNPIYLITSIDFGNRINTASATNMARMFSGCIALETLDLSNFNTAAVTDMTGMFSYNMATSLDLSSFNTAAVTDMSYMFNYNMATSLDLSSFNTAAVTDMTGMFINCENLQTLKLGNDFNTENVTNMSGMFCGCKALTSLDVSSFNTAKVTNMMSMFFNCRSLTSLDLSNFKTEAVTDMNVMFSGCIALETLDVSSFNTANVTNMYWMFQNCKEITSLNVSNFNTGKVTNMEGMFYMCEALTSLNLSNFNTEKVTNMRGMFQNCKDLSRLTFGSKFTTAAVTNMDSMFKYINSSTSNTLDLDLTGFTFNSPTIDNIFEYAGLTKVRVENQTDYEFLKTKKTANITFVKSDGNTTWE